EAADSGQGGGRWYGAGGPGGHGVAPAAPPVQPGWRQAKPGGVPGLPARSWSASPPPLPSQAELGRPPPHSGGERAPGAPEIRRLPAGRSRYIVAPSAVG